MELALRRGRRKRLRRAHGAAARCRAFIHQQCRQKAEGAVAATDVIENMIQIIAAEPLAEIDYIEAVDGISLEPAEIVTTGTLIAMAVKIGETRLIDNFTVDF